MSNANDHLPKILHRKQSGPGGKRYLFEKLLKQESNPDEPVVTFKAWPKQAEFIEAVLSGKYSYLAMGGGIRGTKTIGCLATLCILCRMYPRSRWAVVRKDLPTLRRNVLPAMEKMRLWSGGFVGPLNQSTWTYTCANGSVIIMFAEQFTQDPELERWKGLEVNGFDGEDCSELNEKSAFKMIERAGSYIIPATPQDPTPRQPPPLILANMNPCANWPRKWWFDKWKMGTIQGTPYYFLPCSIEDNLQATDEYKESLKNLPKEEYDRFVLGEWDFVDNPKQLIKAEWVWDARNVEPIITGTRKMGADIARYGDDWTSLYIMQGNQLRKTVSIKHFDTNEVGQSILNLANDPEHPIAGRNVRVDAIGQGAGVLDYCRNKGLPVYEFISGAKAIPRPGQVFQFRNLRDQMWWEGREKLRKREVSLYFADARGNEVPLPEKLVGDLTSIEYEIVNDKEVHVQPKDEVKDVLGRSTDDGDAFMMMLMDLPDVAPRPKRPGSIIIRGN
jgi:hypothetical protein